jgi:hypothetical protein
MDLGLARNVVLVLGVASIAVALFGRGSAAAARG